MTRHNGCKPEQRSLLLPGQARRLTRDEVQEQAAQALALLSAHSGPRKTNALAAPRRAVASLTPEGEGFRARLVCGHEVRVDGYYTEASLPQRCAECQTEGR